MSGENQAELSLVGDQDRRFSAMIAKTIAGMVLAALLTSFSGLYWAARESDTVSAERQTRTVHHAIETSIDELALQQETVAIWDDAAAIAAAQRPDTEWIHENMGKWL